jgi:hypothetical protein
LSDFLDTEAVACLTAFCPTQVYKAALAACLMNEPEDIRSHLIGKSKEEAEKGPRLFYFPIDITYGLTVAWVCSSN